MSHIRFIPSRGVYLLMNRLIDATSQKLGFTDPAGETDKFQVPPGRVKLTAGTEAVRSLRLSETGVLRWFADCCRTPIGNTAAVRASRSSP